MPVENPSYKLSQDDNDFVAKHVVELSQLPPNEFERFQRLANELMMTALRIEPFLHPDRGNSSDSFKNLFGRPIKVLQQMIVRAREKRNNG